MDYSFEWIVLWLEMIAYDLMLFGTMLIAILKLYEGPQQYIHPGLITGMIDVNFLRLPTKTSNVNDLQH